MSRWSVPAVAVPTLWITRVLLGLSQAAIFPVAAMAVMVYVPADQRVRATSCYIAAGALGAALAPLLMAPTMESFGWRAVFVLSSVLAACESARSTPRSSAAVTSVVSWAGLKLSFIVAPGGDYIVGEYAPLSVD